MNPTMPPITSPAMKIVFAAFWNTSRLYVTSTRVRGANETRRLLALEGRLTSVLAKVP
jgi:hypothetical protein